MNKILKMRTILDETRITQMMKTTANITKSLTKTRTFAGPGQTKIHLASAFLTLKFPITKSIRSEMRIISVDKVRKKAPAKCLIAMISKTSSKKRARTSICSFFLTTTTKKKLI